MVTHVIGQVSDRPVIDLYAGVGLFGLALAARGAEVTLVEGDYSSGRDLELNAAPYPDRTRVSRASVEEFLAATLPGLLGEPRPTIVIDPPRTGLSKEAIQGILRLGPPVLVYVSCDPATLARDARILIDAGYEHGPVTGFDLFPNTAHVESVVSFSR
jgi:23S rRNA (uracil1939-C5)-methyltransferase